MRDTSRRRQEIIRMLQSEGSAQVLALSEQFGVSTQTIRKDLAFLEEHGVSVRCYGGAVAAELSALPTRTQSMPSAACTSRRRSASAVSPRRW